MIVKIQEDENPIGVVFFSAFSVSIDETGKIVVWSKDTDGKGCQDVFKPSSYRIIVENNNDAKVFYKKHM